MEFPYNSHRYRSFSVSSSSQNCTHIFEASCMLTASASLSTGAASCEQKMGSPSKALLAARHQHHSNNDTPFKDCAINGTRDVIIPTTSHLRSAPVTLIQNSRGVVLRFSNSDNGLEVFSQTCADMACKSAMFEDSRSLPQVVRSPSRYILTIGSMTTTPPANENHLSIYLSTDDKSLRSISTAAPLSMSFWDTLDSDGPGGERPMLGSFSARTAEWLMKDPLSNPCRLGRSIRPAGASLGSVVPCCSETRRYPLGCEADELDLALPFGRTELVSGAKPVGRAVLSR